MSLIKLKILLKNYIFFNLSDFLIEQTWNFFIYYKNVYDGQEKNLPVPGVYFYCTKLIKAIGSFISQTLGNN